MADSVKQDLLQTSTGVGHHYRPGYYFPSSNFKSVMREPVPAKLANPTEITRTEQFKTTTGTTHDVKHMGGPYDNGGDPMFKKAPGHWKVNYVKDLHEKLQPGGFRKPLTMGFQTSETQEEFRARPPLSEPKELVPNPQGFNLYSHHTEGPAKKVYPNTTNDKLKGKTFFPKDKGVFDLLDPYLTTTNKDFRRFKPKELAGYAKKDVPTYWVCEEYPKAWGHGPKHNPLPKDSVPLPKAPMRDEMIFKSETQIRRIPNSLVPVPHSGLKSLHTESFQQPSDVKMKEAAYCPVNTPYVLPAPSSKSAFAAPQMYKTEYQNVGSRKPITV